MIIEFFSSVMGKGELAMFSNLLKSSVNKTLAFFERSVSMLWQ
jgi:hypothetical protein